MLADNESISKVLLDTLEHDMAPQAAPAMPRCRCCSGVLLAAKSSRVFEQTAALLDKMTENTPGVRLMAVELTDQLATSGTPADVDLLVRLSTTPPSAGNSACAIPVVLA